MQHRAGLRRPDRLPAGQLRDPGLCETGIVYDDWTIHRLVELVGSGRAAHFLFTAQRIGVETAAAIGLVDLRVDDLAAATASFLADLMRGDDTAMASIWFENIHRAAQ